MRGALHTAFGAIALVGCSPGNSGIDRQVESRITIASGVYGQTTSLDDIGKNSPQYFAMTLNVFAANDGGTPLRTVSSDDVGFFEAELAPGGYAICTAFGRCTDLTVQTGQCVRLDYEFSIGPGWSAPSTRRCEK